MKNIQKIFSCIIALAVLCSCGNDKTETTAEKEPHVEKARNTNTVTLTEEQIKGIGIELGVIEQKQLTASLKANGILQVPNQNKASVNSVYSGVIKSLLIQPGNTVSKGQIIATIANPEFIEIQDEYLSLSPQISLAEQEYARQKELNAGNAGALKNLQAAETKLTTLRTRKATLQQRIQLMGLSPGSLGSGKLVSVLAITSPLSGVVSNVMVKIGSYIDVSTAIAEIVDNSQLHLDLFVYEKDLPKLKNNQTIHFTLTNNPGKEYDAQIYSLGSSFQGESKAVTVHAKVQGEKTGLIDGMSITAVISLEKATVSAVPTEAIITAQGQDYIFVQSEQHSETGTKGDSSDQHNAPGVSFEKIPVVKGTSDIGYTEITLLKDVPSDAKVVVKGSFFVLAKMSNTGEGSHEH